MIPPHLVVITGGSSGIGRAMARRYAAPGRRIVLLGRDAARLEAACEEVRAKGAEAESVAVELAERDALNERAAELVARLGPPDRLICAAGQLEADDAAALERDTLRHLFEVNLLGSVHATEAFLEAMRPRGGAILHVASMVALHPFTGLASYATSKWALRGYHRGLVSALRGTPLHLAIAYPSIVATPMIDGYEGADAPPVYRAWPARDVDKVATKLLRQLERGRRRLFVSLDDRLVDLMLRLAPRWGAAMADAATRWRAGS